MAVITYQEMCAQFARRAGINGSTFSSVTSTDETEVMIANFVAEADLYIQNLYLDWAFHWQESSGTLTAASDAMPRASDLRVLDVNSIIIGKGTTTWHQPQWLEWRGNGSDDGFFDRYETGEKSSSDKPTHISAKPNQSGSFVLSHKITSAGKTYYYAYYQTPTKMTANGSTSVITLYDQEAHWLIVSKALMDYCAMRSNPEVMQAAAAQYEDQMPRLEAMAGGILTQREYMRGGHNDNGLVVAVE